MTARCPPAVTDDHGPDHADRPDGTVGVCDEKTPGEPTDGSPTRAAVILPWERQGRDVSGHDQPRAAEARMAEAVGLTASIGLVVVHTAILPLRARFPPRARFSARTASRW